MSNKDKSTELQDLVKTITGDNQVETLDNKSSVDLINKMAVDMATIKAFMREMRTELALISSQVKYFTQLTETIAEEGPVGNKIGDDALETANEFLQNSPLSKHPMFQEMLKPLQDMIKKTKA